MSTASETINALAAVAAFVHVNAKPDQQKQLEKQFAAARLRMIQFWEEYKVKATQDQKVKTSSNLENQMKELCNALSAQGYCSGWKANNEKDCIAGGGTWNGIPPDLVAKHKEHTPGL